MRVSREKVAENRVRIVETASRLFREGGFEGVGVDAIMNAAGLMLAAEAVTRALERSVEKQSRYANLSDLVLEYLSERHCADRANGCAIAALGADMARQRGTVRRGLTAHVRAQLDHFSRLLRNGPAAKPQARNHDARRDGWSADAGSECRRSCVVKRDTCGGATRIRKGAFCGSERRPARPIGAFGSRTLVRADASGTCDPLALIKVRNLADCVDGAPPPGRRDWVSSGRHQASFDPRI
jgi:TetR/AcrR family transcriptional repressor of nem operon